MARATDREITTRQLQKLFDDLVSVSEQSPRQARLSSAATGRFKGWIALGVASPKARPCVRAAVPFFIASLDWSESPEEMCFRIVAPTSSVFK